MLKHTDTLMQKSRGNLPIVKAIPSSMVMSLSLAKMNGKTTLVTKNLWPKGNDFKIFAIDKQKQLPHLH